MARRKRRPPKSSSFLVDQHRWKLSLLRDFISRFGWEKLKRHTVVPPGVRLDTYVTARRVDYQADKIAAWLVTECEQIPGWSWSVYEDARRRNLDNLRTFVMKRGWDALTDKPIVDSVRLDRWVAHRRDEYKHGRLDAWLIRRLEALPGWTWDLRRASYERNLRELRKYVTLHGWSEIRADTITDSGAAFGQWVPNIRAMHRRGETEKWIEDELESIPGWTWEPRRAGQQRNIQRLARFVAKNGWDAVSDALVVDEVKLGAWISNCRVRYRAGILSEETTSGLEAIRGWSWSGRTTWYQPKDEAGRFVATPQPPRQRQRR